MALSMWIPDFFSIQSDLLFSEILTLVLTICNALLLISVVYRAGVSRTRTGLSMFLYLLTISSIHALHIQWQAQLALLFYLICLLFILSVFRAPHAVNESFLCALMLSVAALFVPDMLLLLPLIWIMFARQHAFSFKVWLASMVGLAVVTIYVGLAYWLNWLNIGFISEWLSRQTWQLYPLNSGVSTIVLLALGIVFTVFSFHDFRFSNTTTQSFVVFNTLPFLVSAVLMFFPMPSYPSLQVVAICSYICLATKVFMMERIVWSGILFLLNIITWGAVFTLQFI